MMSETGPFQILENALEELPPQERRYDCSSYHRCLAVAAALNWDGFHCVNCRGELDERLMWQVRIAQKRDSVAKEMCDLPGTEGLLRVRSR